MIVSSSESYSDTSSDNSELESKKCESTIEKVKRSKRQRTHGILETRQNVSGKSILKNVSGKAKKNRNCLHQ